MTDGAQGASDAELTHLDFGFCTVTLTLTDAAGNTGTDQVGIGIIDATPD